MPTPDKLTRREREIMEALYALGNRGSAEEIRERLIDPPGYSAVRAMLVRLEAKGFVRHREEGLRYVYVPTTSRGSAQKQALHKLVSVFFRGSPSRAATALLNQENWSDDEIDALHAEIDRVRKQRRKQS